MYKREKLTKIKLLIKTITIERNIYIISTILLLNTIIINIINLIYTPQLINGFILEINLIIIIFCIYSIIKHNQQIVLLQNKESKLTIKNRSKKWSIFYTYIIFSPSLLRQSSYFSYSYHHKYHKLL